MATDTQAMVIPNTQTRDIASIDLTAIERVIVAGDLSKLTADERWDYYQGVCRSIGLNPFTQPFSYLKLSSGLTLYALKGAAEQLRRIYGVSIGQPTVQFEDGLVVVTVTARDSTGRTDSDMGLVSIEGLKGESRANAVMKAITKAKRRVTLSMCGLGMLDETEVETIPGAKVVTVEEAHGSRKPKADFLDNGWRYETTAEREAAEVEYTRLAELAVERSHPRADDIRTRAAGDLSDGQLAGSVAALQRWEKSLRPAAAVDDTNAGDEEGF